MRHFVLSLFFCIVVVLARGERSFDFRSFAPTEYNQERGFGFEPGFPVRAEAGGVTGDSAFFFSVDVPEGNWRVTVQLAGAPGGSRTTVKAELRRLMVESLALAPGEVVKRTFIVNVRNPTIPERAGIAAGKVRLKAPRETTQEAWAWDRRLTLEFSGERPVLQALEIVPAEVPTIFLLGD